MDLDCDAKLNYLEFVDAMRPLEYYSPKPQQVLPKVNLIRDLSFAMFMGIPLEDPQYKNYTVADRNKKIVEFFSKPIAKVNK